MVVGTVRGEESRMRERRPDPRRDFTCRWLRPNICTTRRKPARGNIVARLLKDTHYRIETITAPPCVCVPSCVCVCICANKAGSPRRLPPLFLSLPPFKPTALVSKLIAAAQGSRWKIGAVHALTRIKDSTRCFLPFLSFFFFLLFLFSSFFPPHEGGLKAVLDRMDYARWEMRWEENWRLLPFSRVFYSIRGIFGNFLSSNKFLFSPQNFSNLYTRLAKSRNRPVCRKMLYGWYLIFLEEFVIRIIIILNRGQKDACLSWNLFSKIIQDINV